MKELKLDFIGIHKDKYPVLYHNSGTYSIVIEITNSIVQNSADKRKYYDFHQTYANILKTLGNGYTIQKHDIFVKKKYNGKPKINDFLEEMYFEHFKGRNYKSITSYLTITKNEIKSSFWSYSPKEFEQFNINISKILDILVDSSSSPRVLEEEEIKTLIKRFVGVEFNKEIFSLLNMNVDHERIHMGGKVVESISLVDIDNIDLPSEIKPFKEEDLGYTYPTDNLNFLHKIPECETVIYHQVISVPNQRAQTLSLQKKRKKHSSMPDPANDIAESQISSVLNLIEKDNQQLVYSHFNIMMIGKEEEVASSKNFIENELFKLGITSSSNSFNQKELFLTTIPGNTSELQEYDLFLTTSDPALCLLYKESLQKSEDSHYLLNLTDRHGIPISIDPSEKPRAEGRITNMNKFLLGPSGTGKSFLSNSMIRQSLIHGTDIVVIDVGHSYSGICNYYGGKYITYTEDKPITINPFRFEKLEYNMEKREFLKTLIALIWKGAAGTVSELEDTALNNLINDYYDDVFGPNPTIKETSFNTFYEFAIKRLAVINKESGLNIDVNTFKYVLKTFYKGGPYDRILNSEMDSTLFDEKFIVFEIDNIKNNKKLFPIITVIIMDVFLQKMRLKKNIKKLIIEEAWKAIANEMMAEYIKYLYKTVRKFLGQIMLVTQDVEDVLGNEIIKNSIISNSDTIILMDQAKLKDNYAEVAALLSLNEVEKKKIFTIGKLNNKDGRSIFRETYIKRGAWGSVFGVEESIYSYLAYTTERSEKELLERYVETYGNYIEGVKAFARDLENSGKSISTFVQENSKSQIKELT